MESQEWVVFCRLEELPIELQVYILCQLPDVSALLSTIEASRTLLRVFEQFGDKILLGVFANFGNSASSKRWVITQTRTYRHFQDLLKKRPRSLTTLGGEERLLLYQLYLTIRRKIIPRCDAKAVFDVTWQTAKRHGYTRMLVPFGEALARTLEQDGLHHDAECLLRTVQEADGAACSGRVQEVLQLAFASTLPVHIYHFKRARDI
ncbi:hypothetical protein B0I35DRAFT_195783 [Stachybotrys elegans]|uniref:F-box domain-containing protein n=1 Tax=Stachybotrys elegans TaxID=80388 RepID=A0A8K0WK49_9HYPO|nr:hypothetical protein B0I35DRAFT_195783 [Stachybotrys elegans]